MEFDKKSEAELADVYLNSAGDALVACKTGRPAEIDGAAVLAFFVGHEEASKYDRVHLVRRWDDVMEKCRRAMVESCCGNSLEAKGCERSPAGVLHVYESECEGGSCLREVSLLVDPGFSGSLPRER